MLSRRDLLLLMGSGYVGAKLLPLTSSLATSSTADGSVRCINVVNFIRGVEPRFETDLLLPVKKQMEIILEHKLPATWLLQYDALVVNEFTDYLKTHMAKDHEVGFWFEMNEKHCNAAGVKWRGRPGYEWDHFPPVAFTIGYTPEERVKLADAAMSKFKEIWGYYPKSIASWNLDSITIAHLTEKYKVDAYAVCRDQIATDGFTIWGAPIAGYYPSKTNCWSPALRKANQIDTPIFRMLGQDPVRYYSRRYKLPDGRMTSEPDTMEPVWAAGRSPHFIKSFLDMISKEQSLKFAYAQLGQENSFPWQQMQEGYPIQMKALADLRDTGTVHVETMGDSGRRFKKAFKTTPTQAQIMLDDPFGDIKPAETSIWYQSRFYRANLHFKDDLPFLRDLTIYSDKFPQPYLTEATRLNDVEQRMPAVLDGFHWSKGGDPADGIGSGGFFVMNGQRLRLSGRPSIREEGDTFFAELPLQDGKLLKIKFEEKAISISLDTKGVPLALSFEWDASKAALRSVEAKKATYNWQGYPYTVDVITGSAASTESGWAITSAKGEIKIQPDQSN